MRTLQSVTDLRATLRDPRRAGQRIAFVPTMGNLHAGHLKLVHHARAQADCVVSSIFVNPTQFGAGEDLDTYPRTPDTDREKLAETGADVLFMPDVDTMYPGGLTDSTRVTVPGLSDILCGAERPGHFTGVATVVTKLLNLVQPDVAVFGEKDYQQLVVIRRLVRDLCFPVRVDGVPTARADDGLALSSRNGYLSPDERAMAPRLYQTLCATRAALEAGNRDFNVLETAACEALREAGFRPGYYSIRDAGSLAPPGKAMRHAVILAAASIGNTRLIDNVTVVLP